VSAFLLVKPDGVNRGLLPMVRSALTAQGSAIAAEQDVVFRDGDIPLLWPRIQAHTHPLTVRLITLYLTSAPSRLVALGSIAELPAAQGVKRSIRRRFGNRMFGNLIHAADSPEEAARELEFLLAPATGRDRMAMRHPAAQGTVSRISSAEAAAECNRIWADLNSGRFLLRSDAIVARSTDEYQVVLHDDDVNTPDDFVGGLLEVFPQLGLGEALHAVVQLDFTDSSPIVSCAEAEFESISERLAAEGIRNISLHRRPSPQLDIACGLVDVPRGVQEADLSWPIARATSARSLSSQK
jgi:nucleoside diphosphate kinase